MNTFKRCRTEPTHRRLRRRSSTKTYFRSQRAGCRSCPFFVWRDQVSSPHRGPTTRYAPSGFRLLAPARKPTQCNRSAISHNQAATRYSRDNWQAPLAAADSAWSRMGVDLDRRATASCGGGDLRAANFVERQNWVTESADPGKVRGVGDEPIRFPAHAREHRGKRLGP